jgi:hypothetical protein
MNALTKDETIHLLSIKYNFKLTEAKEFIRQYEQQINNEHIVEKNKLQLIKKQADDEEKRIKFLKDDKLSIMKYEIENNPYFEQFQTQEEKDRIQKIKKSMTICYPASYRTCVDDANALKDSLVGNYGIIIRPINVAQYGGPYC